MRKVELLLAWESGRWDTEVVEIPRDSSEEACDCAIVNWFLLNHGEEDKYTTLVLASVYNSDVEED